LQKLRIKADCAGPLTFTGGAFAFHQEPFEPDANGDPDAKDNEKAQ